MGQTLSLPHHRVSPIHNVMVTHRITRYILKPSFHILHLRLKLCPGGQGCVVSAAREHSRSHPLPQGSHIPSTFFPFTQGDSPREWRQFGFPEQATLVLIPGGIQLSRQRLPGPTVTLRPETDSPLSSPARQIETIDPAKLLVPNISLAALEPFAPRPRVVLAPFLATHSSPARSRPGPRLGRGPPRLHTKPFPSHR